MKILLDSALKSLEIILAGAITTNQLPFVSSYVDINQASIQVVGMNENDGISNSATAVTVVGAPATGNTRQIKSLTVSNADTAAATVTVQVNNNGTKRTLIKVTLQVGDNLVFTDD